MNGKRNEKGRPKNKKKRLYEMKEKKEEGNKERMDAKKIKETNEEGTKEKQRITERKKKTRVKKII